MECVANGVELTPCKEDIEKTNRNYEKVREWQAKHHERVLEHKRRYREKNRDRENLRHRKYFEANRERILERARQKRRDRRSSSFSLEPQEPTTLEPCSRMQLSFLLT